MSSDAKGGRGKNVLVTGGGRGIGRGIVESLAADGWNVVLCGRSDPSRYADFLESVRQKYQTSVTFLSHDISDIDGHDMFLQNVRRQIGRLDALVNNAGITRDTLLLRMSPKDWDLVLEVNLRSVFNYCKAFAPMMLKQRSGSIVNTSSVVGVNGNAGQCNYSASKAGIIGFTKSLAKELGSRGIRCNAIAPGLIETAMSKQMKPEMYEKWLNDIPLHRGGTELDVARTSLFLASDLSEYITGQVICVDGGVSL